MGYVKLVFLILFSLLCQLAFCSSLFHLCLKDQALALLQFKHMFTIDANSTLQSWNKSIDCCSWDGVHCNEATGQVIDLNLAGCGLQGKQFDTFENSSYQGNDGLCGLPLSKDCSGDEGVPQATTPFRLDEEEEEEEGDSSIISWQAVLMGYGCGLVIGLSILYIMLSTQYPAWFSRMDVELEHKILKRMKKHKKRH